MAENPLILLNPKESIKKIGEERVTRVMHSYHSMRYYQLRKERVVITSQKEVDRLSKLFGDEYKYAMRKVKAGYAPFINPYVY